jgi:hypothetical protein
MVAILDLVTIVATNSWPLQHRTVIEPRFITLIAAPNKPLEPTWLSLSLGCREP